MKKQVICIRWGTKYGPEYVNRLYGMVARHITPPFTFTCFTDSSEGVREEVRCLPLPELDATMPVNTFGIWGKSRLWSDPLGDLTGPVLFLDLDLVIVGSMDGFFEHGDPEGVYMARNPNQPLRRVGQSSIYRFPVGKLAPLKERFLADPQGVADEYRFEQRFVSYNAPGGVQFWPKGWVNVFKWHCIPMFPTNYFRTPRPTANAKVVLFPGAQDVPNAIEGRYRSRMQLYEGPWDHLKGTFRPGRRGSAFAHIRRYIRPSPWIAEAWRE
ncbi:glycosyl transferase [Pontivivens ytuae]|uniref:Glycosyl transferase n=1 Tax=Pontivivens ytuae TaxID=2789856 RepID=A0A7S9LUT2_9RHOB|nr:glycosyl transferase [Pontivivens ytuae]QPH55727.1 glycosyl transferase [Pontivivens ytuae]